MRIPETYLRNSRVRIDNGRLMTEHLRPEHHLRLTEIVNHRAAGSMIRHYTRFSVLGELIDKEHERISREIK